VASMSVTSVLYLKDEVPIATGGAADSVIKFWDTRNVNARITQAFNPDAGHILSGSSDGSADVWQVDKPQAEPLKLDGNKGELTVVVD
ncbi:denticleless protein-like protein, partial [Tanacetum coccineum]